MVNLQGKDFLKLADFSRSEIQYLINLAQTLRQQKKRSGHTIHPELIGKSVVVVFAKPSTRTRLSFELGAQELGMNVSCITGGSQMGSKESIADTARVMAELSDGIGYRGFGQDDVEALAKYANVPVWNALSDEYHPTQFLADYLTMADHWGQKTPQMRVVYCGDGRSNVAVSLAFGLAKLGLHFTICAPKQLWPDEATQAAIKAIADEEKATIKYETEPDIAATGAHVIYTDVWVSMGEPESVWAERIDLLTPYQVNKNLMAKADPQAIFLHCLPAFHDLNTIIGATQMKKFGLTSMEVTDEVFNSKQSHVFLQSQNRKHTIKAVMLATMAKDVRGFKD